MKLLSNLFILLLMIQLFSCQIESERTKKNVINSIVDVSGNQLAEIVYSLHEDSLILLESCGVISKQHDDNTLIVGVLFENGNIGIWALTGSSMVITSSSSVNTVAKKLSFLPYNFFISVEEVEVIGVYEYLSNKAQDYENEITAYHKQSSLNPKKEKSPLPEYEVADKIKLINGRIFADLIISEYSRQTPKPIVEETVKRISRMIKADDISVYCSKEAMKSAYSSSYHKANPKARECSIVSYENGVFSWY